MSARTLVIDLAVHYGFQVVGALIILGVGWALARWVGNFADLRLRRREMEPPMRKLVVNALRIAVLLFAGVVALDKFGFQIAPLVAGIGVAGLGIGLALQGVLTNLVAGLTIIFTKPFRIGEYIELVGVHGDVVQIRLFSTTLMHPDRSRVIIPNRKIVGEILHNFGTMRQLHLAITVPRAADLDTVLASARDVVAAHPRVLKDPAPSVGVSQVTDTSIKVSVEPWAHIAHVVSGVEAELYEALLARFRARGIPSPPALHEVRLLNGGSLPDAGLRR